MVYVSIYMNIRTYLVSNIKSHNYVCYLITCTKLDTMVLVIPPEAAANAITKAIRPTAACAIFPNKSKFIHVVNTVHNGSSYVRTRFQ